jgi:hypothetical protein
MTGGGQGRVRGSERVARAGEGQTLAAITVPGVLKDVEADPALGGDVRMVDLGVEGDLRRLERVILGEHDVEEEDTAFVVGALGGEGVGGECECARWRGAADGTDGGGMGWGDGARWKISGIVAPRVRPSPLWI